MKFVKLISITKVNRKNVSTVIKQFKKAFNRRFIQ